MEFLGTKEAFFVVEDDSLLDFTLDGEGDEYEDHQKPISKGASASISSSSSLESLNPETTSFSHETGSCSFPEFVEEELEWLSNKEAFPAVETCFGILSDNPELISNHKSPVSVLENSIIISPNNSNSKNNINTVLSCFGSLRVPTNFPVRSRSKRPRRTRTTGFGEFPSQHFKNNQEPSIMLPPKSMVASSSGGGVGSMGRRCLHCQSDKTPQWRAGPMGPKTLCNACGVRYKSGRLFPEYRPASSPTFLSEVHSNSHRKVVEMRRQKQVATGGENSG